MAVSDAQEDSGIRESNIEKEDLIPLVRKSYYATVRYVDTLVKKFADGIKRLPSKVKDNTHIIITSDHGFLLGEYGRIGKWVLAEAATRVPLTIIPSKNFRKIYKKTKIGTRITAPVDQVDVFPTILEMAGMPEEYRTLAGKSGDALPGVSLSPYFSDPKASTRGVSISEYDTQYDSGRSIAMRSKYFKYIGYTKASRKPLLFDYRGEDHRMVERENVIDNPEYAQVKDWFEGLFQEAVEAGDTKAWLGIKNIEPIDLHYSSNRGVNE